LFYSSTSNSTIFVDIKVSPIRSIRSFRHPHLLQTVFILDIHLTKTTYWFNYPHRLWSMFPLLLSQHNMFIALEFISSIVGWTTKKLFVFLVTFVMISLFAVWILTSNIGSFHWTECALCLLASLNLLINSIILELV